MVDTIGIEATSPKEPAKYAEGLRLYHGVPVNLNGFRWTPQSIHWHIEQIRSCCRLRLVSKTPDR